jgi:hypothetical protein
MRPKSFSTLMRLESYFALMGIPLILVSELAPGSAKISICERYNAVRSREWLFQREEGAKMAVVA